jgi:hypothetical protein
VEEIVSPKDSNSSKVRKSQTNSDAGSTQDERTLSRLRLAHNSLGVAESI